MMEILVVLTNVSISNVFMLRHQPVLYVVLLLAIVINLIIVTVFQWNVRATQCSIAIQCVVKLLVCVTLKNVVMANRNNAVRTNIQREMLNVEQQWGCVTNQKNVMVNRHNVRATNVKAKAKCVVQLLANAICLRFVMALMLNVRLIVFENVVLNVDLLLVYVILERHVQDVVYRVQSTNSNETIYCVVPVLVRVMSKNDVPETRRHVHLMKLLAPKKCVVK
mmetsp:Transcript_6291/g.10830  ORF Transcript_6291/g.10830 Transcript_6291/m.10830 type:complete len:222 (+) Transcript_6291:2255-2920(+)